MQLVFVGSSGAGKTQFIESLRGKKPSPMLSQTQNAYKQNITLDGQKFELWDTCGTKIFRLNSYYRQMDGVIFESLTNLMAVSNFQLYFDHFCKITQRPPVALVATKADKADERVIGQELQREAQRHNLLYFEFNANDFVQAREILLEIARAANTGVGKEAAIRAVLEQLYAQHEQDEVEFQRAKAKLEETRRRIKETEMQLEVGQEFVVRSSPRVESPEQKISQQDEEIRRLRREIEALRQK